MDNKNKAKQNKTKQNKQKNTFWAIFQKYVVFSQESDDIKTLLVKFPF